MDPPKSSVKLKSIYIFLGLLLVVGTCITILLLVISYRLFPTQDQCNCDLRTVQLRQLTFDDGSPDALVDPIPFVADQANITLLRERRRLRCENTQHGNYNCGFDEDCRVPTGCMYTRNGRRCCTG
jgi:hypothetical protein